MPDVDTLLVANPPARDPAGGRAGDHHDLQAGTFASEDAARPAFASGLTDGGLPGGADGARRQTKVSYQVVVHGTAGPTEAAAARTEAMALGAPQALIISGS